MLLFLCLVALYFYLFGVVSLVGFRSVLCKVSNSALSGLSFVVSGLLLFGMGAPCWSGCVFVFRELLLDFYLALPSRCPIVLSVSLLLGPTAASEEAVFHSSIFGVFGTYFGSSHSGSELLSWRVRFS